VRPGAQSSSCAEETPVVEAASTKPEAASADRHGEGARALRRLDVIVPPGLARDVAAKIASELEDDFRELDTGVAWRTELAADRVVVPPTQTTDIIEAARQGRHGTGRG
jgi:hypothetical protein